MRLYDTRKAPNPRRVRWVMAEKGIDDIEIVPVDLMGGAHRTPEYLARTTLPNVPALELDDGTTITETVAICRYLEARHPEPNLFGRDAKELAVIEMWTRRAEMMFATPLMLAIRHTHPALAVIETQSAEFGRVNREVAERGLAMLDRRLRDSDYIGADRITIADVVAFTALDFGRMIKFAPDPALDGVARWAAAMRARPAAAAGM